MICSYAYSCCDAMEQLPASLDSKYSRILAGSSFCDNYYLHTPLALWEAAARLARQSNRKITLVIPIPGQKLLFAVKEKTAELFRLFSDVLDEVIVNDFATMEWIAKEYPGCRLWCGRLLVKDTRDPRYSADTANCRLLDHIRFGRLFGYDISGLELDLFSQLSLEETPKVTLGIHFPYAYLSCGRICELGSIGRSTDQMFRPSASCARQCTDTWLGYENQGFQLLKHGRAVYGRNDRLPASELAPQTAEVRIIIDGFAEKTGWSAAETGEVKPE